MWFASHEHAPPTRACPHCATFQTNLHFISPNQPCLKKIAPGCDSLPRFVVELDHQNVDHAHFEVLPCGVVNGKAAFCLGPLMSWQPLLSPAHIFCCCVPRVSTPPSYFPHTTTTHVCVTPRHITERKKSRISWRALLTRFKGIPLIGAS